MKTKIVSPILLLCVFNFLLVSCNMRMEPEAYPTITPRPLPEWLSKFIVNPTCPPPCWENIVPGETTLEQAKTLLEKHPDVRNLYIEEEFFPFGKSLMWLNGSAPVGNENIVQMVWLSTSFYGVALDRIVHNYGQPKFVIFTSWYEGIGSVDLLYPDIGLVIRLRGYDKGQVPDNIDISISPYDEVRGILFFSPGLDYYYEKMIWNEPLRQYEWKGYNTYP